MLPRPKKFPLFRPQLRPRPSQIQIAGRTVQDGCQKSNLVPSKDVSPKASKFAAQIAHKFRLKNFTAQLPHSIASTAQNRTDIFSHKCPMLQNNT